MTVESVGIELERRIANVLQDFEGQAVTPSIEQQITSSVVSVLDEMEHADKITAEQNLVLLSWSLGALASVFIGVTKYDI